MSPSITLRGGIREAAADPVTGEPEQNEGAVCWGSIPGGLHHHYYRQAA